MSQTPNQPPWPRQQPGPGQQSWPASPPPQPHARHRFRWWLVAVPAAALLVAWLMSGIEPAMSWHDVARSRGAAGEVRYGQLAILGLAAVALVAVLRVLRKKRGNP